MKSNVGEFRSQDPAEVDSDNFGCSLKFFELYFFFINKANKYRTSQLFFTGPSPHGVHSCCSAVVACLPRRSTIIENTAARLTLGLDR